MTEPTRKRAMATPLPSPVSSDPNNTSGSAEQPVQGRVATQTRYRDRPTDDGKHGDEDAEPRADEFRRKSAEGVRP